MLLKCLKSISDELNSRDWLSTQTAAWCLYAAARFSEEFYNDGNETAFELTLNGKKQQLRHKKYR